MQAGMHGDIVDLLANEVSGGVRRDLAADRIVLQPHELVADLRWLSGQSRIGSIADVAVARAPGFIVAPGVWGLQRCAGRAGTLK